MSKYILDCGAPSASSSETICTLTGYAPPPATVEHFTLGPTWWVPIIAGVILAVILATAIVRYKRHVEQGLTDRRRIENPPKECPTCGWKVGA